VGPVGLACRGAFHIERRSISEGAIRAAARLEFPEGDVEEMLGDIERGYHQDVS
jgi:hypothetical protein